MPVNPLGRVTPVTSKPRGDEAQPTLLSNPYALADPKAAQDYENGYQYAQTIGHLELAQHSPEEWAYATPPWREGFAAAAKAMGLGEFADTLLSVGKEAAMKYPATAFIKTAMGPLGKTLTGLGAGLGGLALGAGLGTLHGGEDTATALLGDASDVSAAGQGPVNPPSATQVQHAAAGGTGLAFGSPEAIKSQEEWLSRLGPQVASGEEALEGQLGLYDRMQGAERELMAPWLREQYQKQDSLQTLFEDQQDVLDRMQDTQEQIEYERWLGDRR